MTTPYLTPQQISFGSDFFIRPVPKKAFRRRFFGRAACSWRYLFPLHRFRVVPLPPPPPPPPLLCFLAEAQRPGTHPGTVLACRFYFNQGETLPPLTRGHFGCDGRLCIPPVPEPRLSEVGEDRSGGGAPPVADPCTSSGRR